MKNRRIHMTRFLIIVAIALVGCYISLRTSRTAGADTAKKVAPPPLPAMRGPAAIKHLEQTGLYNSLSAAVTAARYRVEARKEGGYEASNPEQDYRTIFTPEGVEVRGSSRMGREWRMGMKLTAYGYGERKKAVTAAGVKGAGDRIEYERRVRDGGSISEWYVNQATGLEQGFTIPQAPGKRKAGESLNLWLKLSGGLKARLAESGQAILLNGRGAGAGLRYDKLHANDAIGRELEARMKLSGDRVILEVADEAAIYPLTIDPTLAQQAKLTASDAAAGDAFGSSVAISGDTAVVGAPFDNVSAISDAGSAYVYVRSGTRWSQQAKLTAGDAAAGDFFGSAVGISGDTVVVGAFGDDDAGSFSGSAYIFAPPPDPYADAVAAGTSPLILNPANAVGAPDGNSATIVSALGTASLVLDMGAGEEGTGDLIVHYGGLAVEVNTVVDFLRADGSVISTGQLHMTDLNTGVHTAVVSYAGAPAPYRFVSLRAVLLGAFQVDAVEATSIVAP